MPYTFRGFTIPDHMERSLRDYILKGFRVGAFLSAVLDNDLALAVNLADEQNLANLPAFIGYLHNEAPGTCHGSQENRLAWLKRFETGTATIRLTREPVGVLPREDDWTM